MSKTYCPFGDSKEKYEMAPPTNARTKKLVKSELRAGIGYISDKVQTAKAFAWDPVEVIPDYTDEDGQESEIDRISLPEHMADVIEICLEGADVDGRKDEVRLDVAGEVKSDFTSRAGVTSAASSR